MAKEVRQGLGLLCIAAICLLVMLVASGQPATAARAVAILFGIGGLALIATGLLRDQSA